MQNYRACRCFVFLRSLPFRTFGQLSEFVAAFGAPMRGLRLRTSASRSVPVCRCEFVGPFPTLIVSPPSLQYCESRPLRKNGLLGIDGFATFLLTDAVRIIGANNSSAAQDQNAVGFDKVGCASGNRSTWSRTICR